MLLELENFKYIGYMFGLQLIAMLYNKYVFNKKGKII
jgi:hypothetical protein